MGWESADAVLGKDYLSFVHHKDRARVEKHLQDAFLRKPSEFEFLSADSKLYFKSMISPLNHTDPVQAIIGVTENITERKRAEENYIEASDFQNLIKESSPDLLFVKDKNFKIVEANSAFLALYPEKMRDKVVGYTTVEEYDNKEAEAFLEQDRIAFRDGHSQVIEKIQFPNGKVRTLFTKKTRFENAKGEPFILGMARDVTERESLIEDLSKSNHDLERFASVVSHDLKEPLRSIYCFTHLLKDDIATDRKSQQSFKSILRNIEHMKLLVDNLLFYSKLSRKTLPFELVDLQKILQFSFINLTQMIKESKAKITQDKLPHVMGDKIQLIQLFQNLINNAIKHHKGDAIEIHITQEEHDTYWLFSVVDNGQGIEPKYLRRIDAIFHHTDNTPHYQGTGLGLVICRDVVEHHGGTISVKSELGKGAAFSFTLPKTETANTSV